MKILHIRLEVNVVKTSREQAKRCSGFTLIEMMLVVVVMSILVAIAAPSFDSLTKKNNVEALQSQLLTALAVARSEAASRNRPVGICKSNNSASCVSGASWSDGWIVFEDSNNDGSMAVADDIVIETAARNGDYSVTVADADGAVTELFFSSQGFLVSRKPVTFTLCDPDDNLSHVRGIYVNNSGLVIRSKDTDGDGTHNAPGVNAELSCS